MTTHVVHQDLFFFQCSGAFTCLKRMFSNCLATDQVEIGCMIQCIPMPDSIVQISDNQSSRLLILGDCAIMSLNQKIYCLYIFYMVKAVHGMMHCFYIILVFSLKASCSLNPCYISQYFFLLFWLVVLSFVCLRLLFFLPLLSSAIFLNMFSSTPAFALAKCASSPFDFLFQYYRVVYDSFLFSCLFSYYVFLQLSYCVIIAMVLGLDVFASVDIVQGQRPEEEFCFGFI